MMEDQEFWPQLTVVQGAMRGVRFRLQPGSRVIGRAATVDIVLDDEHVSRRHAAVRLAGGRVSLADMGSTNGTWLNDCQVAGVARLSDGDRIRLGRVELRFFDPSLARTDPVGLSLAGRGLGAAGPAGQLSGGLTGPTRDARLPARGRLTLPLPNRNGR